MANGTMLPKAKPFPSSIRPPDAVSGNWGGRKESGWDGAGNADSDHVYLRGLDPAAGKAVA